MPYLGTDPSTSGLSNVDQWRLSTNVSANTSETYITSNLEQVDDASWSGLGTGMTESSGVFSFPTTGIYDVEFIGSIQIASGTSSRYILLGIDVTTDDSAYNDRAISMNSISGLTSTTYQTGVCRTLVDVTDISNVKVKFWHQWATATNGALQGNTGYNRTTFTFKRLGNT